MEEDKQNITSEMYSNLELIFFLSLIVLIVLLFKTNGAKMLSGLPFNDQHPVY